jgi:chromate transporter
MKSDALDFGAYLMLLSLIAIGGIDSVVPDIYRYVVETRDWMSQRQFADLYAIGRGAPGPNSIFVTLLGWQVAGLSGAVVATLAFCGPPCVLTFFVSRIWHRFEGARWRRVVQAGLSPIAVGLVLGTGYILTSAVAGSWTAAAIIAGSMLVALHGRIHPLWVLAMAGIAGVTGIV